MSPPLQAKLLTVLEQRQVRPVGASKVIDFDVRVIAATNVPRAQLHDEQNFRQDLLFRLNTVEVELPALRERVEDIPLLAEHYAAVYGRKYGQAPKRFAEATVQAMQAYAWPGNVRALRHAVERATILSASDTLQPEDFQLQNTAAQVAPAAQPELRDAEDLNLERMEKQVIQKALTRHRYNISHAAKELGLTRAALYRRMEKHGL